MSMSQDGSDELAVVLERIKKKAAEFQALLNTEQEDYDETIVHTVPISGFDRGDTRR